MNIIFGDAVKQIPESYIILELDTVKVMPQDKKTKTYCIIEKASLEDFMNLEKNKFFHVRLLEQYRQQNWEECRSAIASLKGCWNGELDTFYEDIERRVEDYSVNPPSDDWDGTLVRTA